MQPASKFLIFGQSRSGSTLLRDLLNSHPEVECAGEPLRDWVPWPETTCEIFAARSSARVFGCKVFVHHLRDRQFYDDSARFLERMQRRGYRILYLERANLVRHALSNFIRRETGVTHAMGRRVELDEFELDIEAFVAHLHVRERFWREAEEAIDGRDFLRIVYEHDLMDHAVRQKSMDRVFEYLGVESVSVGTSLEQINTKRLSDLITNYDELKRALEGSDFERWLET